VFKKEFAGFFRTMTGFVYLVFFFALTGYYFTINNLLAQSNDVREYFSTMLFTLMFLIPILTMRLLSEERKLRTDQLLFTSPLSVRAVVLGKFFAAFAVFLIGICSTFVFVITIQILGGAEMITVLGCYIGAILAGAGFIALGLFVSSITESQVISAIITYAVLIGLYVVSMLAGYVQSGFWVAVLDYVAVFGRFTEFTFGIFDPAAAFYYLSLTALFLFFTILSAGRGQRSAGA
jgi:ABC-2 type transport system permease protein